MVLPAFIVGNEQEAIEALRMLHTLDRKRIRERFEARFSARRMAQDYLEIYHLLAETVAPPQLSLIQ